MSIESPIQGIAKPRFFLMGALNSSTANGNNFISIAGAGADIAGTEANSTITVLTPFMIKRVMGRTYINSKNAASTIEMRVNSAGVSGAAFTANAGATGNFDSGEINVIVPAGSTVDWRCDTSASASGNIAFRISAECQTL